MTSKPKAIFIGYQERTTGPPVALYNVIGGPHDKSTKSKESLDKLGIEIIKEVKHGNNRRTQSKRMG